MAEATTTGAEEASASAARVSVGDDAASIPLTPEKKNARDIICVKCGCCILKANVGVLVAHEADLPRAEASAEEGESNAEHLVEFWFLKDMFDFHNIGFSRPKTEGSTIKYLSCADCELGPLGYHDTAIPKAMYLAPRRVAYKAE